jgi:hypothetical protein
MHTLTFSFAHNSDAAERAGLAPSLVRAVLSEPRQAVGGPVYPYVVWIAEIQGTGLISQDIRRLTRLAKRDNKGVEFDVAVPVAWLSKGEPRPAGSRVFKV